MFDSLIKFFGGVTKKEHDLIVFQTIEDLTNSNKKTAEALEQAQSELAEAEAQIEELEDLVKAKSATIVALKEEIETKNEAAAPSSFKIGSLKSKSIQLFKSIRGAKEENVVKFYFGKVIRYARLDGDKNDHGLFYKEGKGAEYKHITFKK
jgi:hypothetical protein|nr:MAG TPA: Proteasome-associated ATPase, Prokaryotic ubiquitin-like protein coil alpha helix, ATP-binding.8A [Caudoviricetes sp.]